MAELVLYYSRADENYFGGDIRNVGVGNTEKIASMIEDVTGADSFKIVPSNPYSSKYEVCMEEAKADLYNNARPEVKNYLDSIEDYNTVYIGFPNYCGTMPMHVFTFLEHYNFSGKNIKPFCTHEGDGFGQSVDDIKRICPGAVVERGLAIKDDALGTAKKAVENWV